MIVNKVPVKKLIEFRRLSERSQSTFANKLKIPKKLKSDNSGGGDYWIRSTSGISNAFKLNDSSKIKEKIDEVLGVYGSTKNALTKLMYKRNLEILHNYQDFDFSNWRPSADLKFLSKPKTPLLIKGIPLQIIPHHVFSYDHKGEPTVGAIWFIIWLNGFKPGDLGIYAEAIFRYLSDFYSKHYKVDPNYCLTVDALSTETASYQQVVEGTIPSWFQNTIDALNKYLV